MSCNSSSRAQHTILTGCCNKCMCSTDTPYSVVKYNPKNDNISTECVPNCEDVICEVLSTLDGNTYTNDSLFQAFNDMKFPLGCPRYDVYLKTLPNPPPCFILFGYVQDGSFHDLHPFGIVRYSLSIIPNSVIFDPCDGDNPDLMFCAAFTVRL